MSVNQEVGLSRKTTLRNELGLHCYKIVLIKEVGHLKMTYLVTLTFPSLSALMVHSWTKAFLLFFHSSLFCARWNYLLSLMSSVYRLCGRLSRRLCVLGLQRTTCFVHLLMSCRATCPAQIHLQLALTISFTSVLHCSLFLSMVPSFPMWILLSVSVILFSFSNLIRCPK